MNNQHQHYAIETLNSDISEPQFEDLFMNLPLPLAKSLVANIFPYFRNLEDGDIIKQRFHSLRTVIDKRARTDKTSGLWQILLVFAFERRSILFPEDQVKTHLIALLDAALEDTQTSWTITSIYHGYLFSGEVTLDSTKTNEQLFEWNDPDASKTTELEKIKHLIEKNGLHTKAGILWHLYIELLLSHRRYQEAFDAIEMIVQLPVPFENFIQSVKAMLNQDKNKLNDSHDHTEEEENSKNGYENDNNNGELNKENSEAKGDEENMTDIQTDEISNRKNDIIQLLDHYSAPLLIKSREEFEGKRKELVKSADPKAVQWLQKYFGAWTDYLDLLETDEQLKDTNFQMKCIAMGIDLLVYEYKRLLIESTNLKTPLVVVYPIFDKLATRIMSYSQLHQSFANDQKWILSFSSVLKTTMKNNLDFWITLISLDSLSVGPYFNFATTQDVAVNVKKTLIEATAMNEEWAKLPPLQFVTAEINAEISQLNVTEESEIKSKSKEIWESKIKNYESLVDIKDDRHIESLASLWFEYMETLGDEDLEPYFEQALSFQPLRLISTVWMDYVSEAIDKDINRGYELFQKALGSVKEQYKDSMWQELFTAVKQDTGLTLEELKELVSSLGKETGASETKPSENALEMPKELPIESYSIKPSFIDIKEEKEDKDEKKVNQASPKPVPIISNAAAKKGPSPGKKHEISPTPGFPKKRPAPTALSPKLGKRRKLAHEHSQMPGFFQPQRPGSPPLIQPPFRPTLPQGQSLPFTAGPMMNSFGRPQLPLMPNQAVNPMQLIVPQLQQVLPALQLQQLAQLMQSKQLEQQAIQLQQQLQQLVFQANANPVLSPILAPQIRLICQRLLSLQQPGVVAAAPVPSGQLPFHKPPIQQDKVDRLEFDTQFQLDVKYIQALLPHFNIDDFKRKPEEFDLSIQIEPLENVLTMFLRQKRQTAMLPPSVANLPPLPDYTVQQIQELVKNPTFREIIKQLQMRQASLEMELAQRREQVLSIQSKERNALLHVHNMRLQATPGRTDYVLRKNEADLKTLEQGLKQQLLEFDQQTLRDLDKKIEEQQIVLQQAGVPGFFPTQSQQQLAQQAQILDVIVQKIKEAEKTMHQSQSRAFDQPPPMQQPQQPLGNFQHRPGPVPMPPQSAQPLVQQSRDPRLPQMEISSGNSNAQQPPVDALAMLQSRPELLELLRNNPALLIALTQATPQQQQEIIGQLVAGTQGPVQQQQQGLPNMGMQSPQQGLPNLGMQKQPQMQGLPNMGMPMQQQMPNIGIPMQSPQQGLPNMGMQQQMPNLGIQMQQPPMQGLPNMGMQMPQQQMPGLPNMGMPRQPQMAPMMNQMNANPNPSAIVINPQQQQILNQLQNNPLLMGQGLPMPPQQQQQQFHGGRGRGKFNNNRGRF